MASSQEVAHFMAIAAGEAECEDERMVRALSASPGERMQLGIRLGLQVPWTAAVLAEIDAETDAQMELARRRIALGLGLGQLR